MYQVIPIGSGEAVQFLAHEFNDNTIRFVLHYPGLLDPQVLCAAARAVVMSVDVLHSSFCFDGTNACWHVHDDLVDDDFFTHVSVDADPTQSAEALALQPADREAKAQLHAALVDNGHICSVVIRVSHLCADGTDAKYLLRKLVEAYVQILSTGSAAGLQIKNGSRDPRQAYEHLHLREKLALCRIPFSKIKSEFPYPGDEPGEPRLVKRILPAESLAAARQKAKACGATVNDLLLAACYHAYAALPGIDSHSPMRISGMIDVRQHCVAGDSAGLSSMAGALRTELPQGICRHFEDTLRQIAAQTQRVKSQPHAGLEGFPLLYGAVRRIPLRLLLKAADGIYRNMSLSLTNLGQLDPCACAMGGLAPIGGMAGGPVKYKPGMQITAVSIDGQCVLSVVGRYTAEDQQLLEQMLDAVVREIAGFAKRHQE